MYIIDSLKKVLPMGASEKRIDDIVDKLLKLAFDKQFPILTGRNWREWDWSFRNRLRPFEGVLDILLSKVVKGQAGYSQRIDDALLTVIDLSLHSDLQFVLLSLQDGERGANAYCDLEFFCTTAYASSIERNALEKIESLRQEADESFGDYSLRVLRLYNQANDAGIFKKSDMTSTFIESSYKGIKSEETNHPKATILSQMCGDYLTDLITYLQLKHSPNSS